MKISKILARVLLSSLLFGFILLTIFYYNDKTYQQLIQLQNKYPYVQKILVTLDNFYNEIDIYKKFSRSELDETDIVRLSLSGSDVKSLNENIENFKSLGFIKDELNPWRKAKIQIGQSERRIKFKIHGTSISPLLKGGFSLRVKHKKEDEYLNSMREFSLISLKDDANISTIVINKIADKYGLIAPHGKMVQLRVNNVSLGTFMMVEHHDKEWLERNHKLTNYTVIKSNDDWDRKENFSGTAHISSFDNFIENKELKGTSGNNSIALGALDLLFSAISREDLDTIKKLIDIDYLSRFLALSVLANNAHPIAGDNLRYIYDFTTGKFKFLFRIEDTIKPINNSLIEFNSSWFESYFVDSSNFDLFKILTRDEQIRKLRDSYLIKLIQDKDKLISDAKADYLSNYPAILEGDSSLRRHEIMEDIFFLNLENNFQKIQRYLNYAKVFVSVNSVDDKFELRVANDSFTQVDLIGFAGYPKEIISLAKNDSYVLNESDLVYHNLEKSIEINGLSLDSNMLPISKAQKIPLTENLYISKLFLRNNITDKNLTEEQIYVNYLSARDLYSYEDELSSLNANNINYSIEEDYLTVQTGDFELRSNLIFPENFKIILEKGIKFLLNPNVSILVQSDILINGTEENPVQISRMVENKPFGTFAIIGSSKKINVNINYLNISGGNEALVGGVRYLGQLSIHNSITSLHNTIISNSSSDDGLNIRNSSVEIIESEFSDNYADQVDLDFCTGIVRDSTFKINTGRGLTDQNGDGFDVSGSKIRLLKNNFSGFRDKGISVGENSNVLIQDNTFRNNKNAITIKDGSNAFVLDNQFEVNEFMFSIYVKKPFYTNPKLYTSLNIQSLDVNNLITGSSEVIFKNQPKDLILSEYESK